MLFVEPKRKFEVKKNKKYEIKAIINSMIYDKMANNQMLDLYHLIFWKDYLEKKNTWKLSAIVMHL